MMDREKEIRKVVGMLKATQRAATEASLTGAYSTGGAAVARQYNAVLEHLRELDAVPSEKLFPPMQEEVSGGEVALLCAQLAAYLEGELEPEGERRRPRVLIGAGSQLGDLSKLGQRIREHLPEWLKECCGEVEVCCGEAEEETATAAGGRWEEFGDRMEELAERLLDDDLSAEERAAVAREMAEVARQQAKQARAE